MNLPVFVIALKQMTTSSFALHGAFMPSRHSGEMNLKRLGVLFRLAGYSLMLPSTVFCSIQAFTSESPKLIGQMFCAAGFVIWIIGDQLQIRDAAADRDRTQSRGRMSDSKFKNE